MVAEDDIDMETLQAQIDTSMSFAHNLVTSWIKPTHLAQLRSGGVNASQLLEEELRKPPRLGVGALVPTAPPLACEAYKLKRKLGKYGAKNECIMEPPPQDSSKSDDEEHKGRPAKRKIKEDPFRHESSMKKRRAELQTTSDVSLENVPKHSDPLLEDLALEELAKHNSPARQEKQRKGPADHQSYVTEGRRSVVLVSPPPMRLPVQTTFSSGLTAPCGSSLSRVASAPVPGKSTIPECSRVHINFMSISEKAKPLGIPLLNLDGPPELTDKTGNTSELKHSAKKRKRRKKKVTGTGDN